VQVCRFSGETVGTNSSRIQSHAVSRFSSWEITFHRFARQGESKTHHPIHHWSCTYSLSLSPQRISRITSALQLDLSQLLSSILSAPPSSSDSYQAYLDELTSALQTFSSLGLIHQAEEIIRKTVVKPFLLKAINRNSLSSSESSSSTSDPPIDHTIPPAYRLSPLDQPVSFKESDSGPLLRLYNLLLRFISQDCGIILSIAERSLSRPRGDSQSKLAITTRRKREDPIGEREEDEEDQQVEGFQILTNVIVDEIASRLVGELGTVIFAAGRPSVFHQVRFLPSLSILLREAF